MKAVAPKRKIFSDAVDLLAGLTQIPAIVKENLSDTDVIVQSRNTGHYWYLHCSGYPNEGSCVIFHKHRFSYPYH